MLSRVPYPFSHEWFSTAKQGRDWDSRGGDRSEGGGGECWTVEERSGQLGKQDGWIKGWLFVGRRSCPPCPLAKLSWLWHMSNTATTLVDPPNKTIPFTPPPQTIWKGSYNLSPPPLSLLLFYINAVESQSESHLFFSCLFICYHRHAV